MLRFSDIECPRPSEQALAERYAAIEERLDVGTPEARQLALADCNSAPAAPLLGRSSPLDLAEQKSDCHAAPASRFLRLTIRSARSQVPSGSNAISCQTARH